MDYKRLRDKVNSLEEYDSVEEFLIAATDRGHPARFKDILLGVKLSKATIYRQFKQLTKYGLIKCCDFTNPISKRRLTVYWIKK
jgi:Fe2+ or Zn2+ uptake regulation protein